MPWGGRGYMAGIVNSRSVRVFVWLYDVAMSVVAMYAGLLFRLGSVHNFDERTLLSGALLPFAAATGIAHIVMRTYRTSWRHASITDLTNILHTVTLAVLAYLPLSFVTTRLGLIPRTSVVISWMVLFLLMAGSRLAYRLFKEGRLFFSRRPMSPGQVPILILGGSTDAEILLRSLDRSTEYYPVGILDNQDSRGALLRGVPILGTVDDVEEVIESFADAGDRPRKLVIVERALPRQSLDHLVDVATRLGLTLARGPDPTQFRPGMQDGPELQPISVEDLLGRPQVMLDPVPVERLIGGCRVLVTGAGGSIGSEIVRQVCALGPSALCLVDASEFNLYSIDAELAERWPDIERVARVTDVRHRAAVSSCFASFRPEIVFHAAALKHVPLVEANPTDGIWTNVIGSRNVADAAAEIGCHAMVLISTDKAVNPTNVMGASKRCAESYCQALALRHSVQPGGTQYMAVRFGNVLGSAGSVVPLFERQLKSGGPITVTHPDIERYFMTIREAVQLVLQASALGADNVGMAGRVFILDMGQPVKIVDLARQMIRLAGLQPDRDVKIRYTGLRPGEKLYEELVHAGEQIGPTSSPRINVASPRTLELDVFQDALDALEEACFAHRADCAAQLLRKLVPEYVARRQVVAHS